MALPALRDEFGDIDIYFFDQLLRGRVLPGQRILDAGCGGGRNLVYLLRQGFEVFAADANPRAVDTVRRMAAVLAPGLPASNFRVEPVEAMTFEADWADVVISSAVLHFAHDHDHFGAMLRGTWRVVAPGGLLFCRLASTIGMADRMRPIGEGRYVLPDRSERYLVDEAALAAWADRLGAEPLDPLKTTIVEQQRCMTTWVVRKTC
jgi:tellurite methyltransferase